MNKSLPKTFFEQKTLKAAKGLVGCFLCRKIDGKTYRFKITETEAYVGPHDLACHSAKGKTKRTEVMFCEAGTLYVYFIYGMYWMLNVVTEKKEYPAAILIRGIEGFSGPGRLTRKLEIAGKHNGKIASPETGIWFEARSGKIPPKKIKASARIGVSYAGPIWSEKKYRFTLEE